MTLSIYDPIKNCFVLKPMQPEIINAFHPDFVKTHMPEFLSSVRTNNVKEEAGKNVTKYIEKRRKTQPSHGTVFGLSDKETSIKPVKMMTTPSHMHRPKQTLEELLKPTEFHIYNKAGAPKQTRSQMMSAIVAKKRKADKNYGTALPNSVNIPKIKPEEL